MVAVAFAAATLVTGVGPAGAAPRHDPRIIDIRVPRHAVHAGDIFKIEVAARNRSGNDYAVGFANIPSGVNLVDERCRAGSGGPSPDTPDCEYAGYTRITHTTGLFVADATAPRHVHLDVCTQPLTGPSTPPTCKTVSIRIRAAEDVARLVSVHRSAVTVHPGGESTFTIEVAARDRGGDDYWVAFVGIPQGVDLRNTCRGTQSNLPSPDGPYCEYDLLTTTTATTTHMVGYFRADGTAPRRLAIEVCAKSFQNEAQQPDCRMVSIGLP